MHFVEGIVSPGSGLWQDLQVPQELEQSQGGAQRSKCSGNVTAQILWDFSVVCLNSPRPMGPIPRHRCLVYNGAPNRHLRAVSRAACERLASGYRCIYLNSEPMIAGFRSYLAATGVDVQDALARVPASSSPRSGHIWRTADSV